MDAPGFNRGGNKCGVILLSFENFWCASLRLCMRVKQYVCMVPLGFRLYPVCICIWSPYIERMEGTRRKRSKHPLSWCFKAMNTILKRLQKMWKLVPF